MKLIIAPHVINESHIVEIIRKLERPVVRYSQITEEKARQADCLIIDCFGLLSSIYRYGEIAYIGGVLYTVCLSFLDRITRNSWKLKD